MKIKVKKGDVEIHYEENQESTSYLKATSKDSSLLVLSLIEKITEQLIKIVSNG